MHVCPPHAPQATLARRAASVTAAQAAARCVGRRPVTQQGARGTVSGSPGSPYRCASPVPTRLMLVTRKRTRRCFFGAASFVFVLCMPTREQSACSLALRLELCAVPGVRCGLCRSTCNCVMAGLGTSNSRHTRTRLDHLLLLLSGRDPPPFPRPGEQSSPQKPATLTL